MDSIEQVYQTLVKIIHLYNTQRPHMALGMGKPEERHHLTG
ncbi:MAG: integrase core domain-containing protein [Bacteroidales bacterium]|nr:integrase core domain-containing protein [Bacteroidales bacterium]